MASETAKVLYAHFKKIGRVSEANQMEVRYPELKAKVKEAKNGEV